MKRIIQILLLLTYAVWLVACYWLFSFQYSPGFFRYHLGTRLPFLALSLLVVVVAPISGYWAISRVLLGRISVVRAALRHVCVSAAPVALFFGVSVVWKALSRRSGRLMIEADEAMGIGIDFMVCIGVVLLSYIIVGGALVFLRITRRKKRPEEY
jgi:hypothetical protein